MKEMKTLSIENEEYEVVDQKARDEIANLYVNNISELKALTNLKAGDVVKTLGYYEVNDGGAGLYSIREKSESDVEDAGAIHFVGSLVAELIIKEVMNVKQFGAKGDGKSNDTLPIQTCINKCSNIYIPAGEYMVAAKGGNTYFDFLEGGISIGSNKRIKLDENAYLKAITNGYYYYRLICVYHAENVIIDGGHIYGDKETHTGSEASEFGHCLSIHESKNVIIRNCDIAYGFGDSIEISADNSAISTSSKNVKIENCTLHDSRRQGISVIASNDTIITGCEIYNISGIAPQSGIDIEANYVDNPVKNIVIENCDIHDCAGASINVTSATENAIINNCNLYTIYVINSKNTRVNDCVINQLNNENKTPALITNCTINVVSIFNEGKINIDNCIINERIISDNTGTETIIKNSNLNLIGSEHSSLIIIRTNDSLFLDNCIFKFDKPITTIPAKKISIKNSLLIPQSVNLDSFQAYEFEFINNKIEGNSLYRLVHMINNSNNSFIVGNIFDVPAFQLLTGAPTQKILIANNVSNGNINTGVTGDNIITQNNIAL